MNYISPSLCFLGLFFFSTVQANVQSYFEHINKDPNALYAFFKNMPKGGELHYHLSGGAYPETMLDLASKGDYCLNTKTWMINIYSAECNGVNTKDLTHQPDIYAKAVNSWSMKRFYCWRRIRTRSFLQYIQQIQHNSSRSSTRISC